MKVIEIKKQLEFYQDLMFQKGYDLGFEGLMEELEQIADEWHNTGATTAAEMLRLEIRKIRGTN